MSGRRRTTIVGAVGLVALVAGLLVACSDRSGVHADPPIEVTGQEPWTSIVGYRGSMFGAKGRVDGPRHLVRSSAGGRWERVNLPDQPDTIQLGIGSIKVVADVLTVTGRGIESRMFAPDVSMDVPVGTLRVWTTDDGRSWRAGPAIEGVAPFVQPSVLSADGILVFGVSSQDGRFRLFRKASQRSASGWSEVDVPITVGADRPAVLESLWVEDGAMTGLVVTSSAGPTSIEFTIIRSGDRGLTWSAAPCEESDKGACGAVPGSDASLLVRGSKSSTDDGATWAAVTISPDVGESCPPIVMRSIVGVPGSESGWVAVASIDRAGGPSDLMLLHSIDGKDLKAVTPERCPSRSSEFSDYSDPIAFDGALWTVHTLAREESGVVATALLRSTDGREWSPVRPELGRARTSMPVVDGSRILVPIHDDLGRLVELVPYKG